MFDYLNENNYHKNNRRKIIFIGRLTKVKKIDMLINVINKLNESNLIYDLKIIGDGPEKTYLQSISSKGVEKGYINFLGSLYDEKKLLSYFITQIYVCLGKCWTNMYSFVILWYSCLYA